MKRDTKSALGAAVLRLLRPVIRILLRHGIPYGVFAEYARQLYVEVARTEFGVPERKNTISRVAIITGLTRKEVSRIQSENDHPVAPRVDRYNRAARVISAWSRDERLANMEGGLPLDGSADSFAQLVKDFAGDVPPRAVLDELIRVKAVEPSDGNRLKLLTDVYVPDTDDDSLFQILGTDGAELISTIDYNMTQPGDQPRFQRKVAYDNLPRESLQRIQRLVAERGQELLVEVDQEISRLDRDINPDTHGSGCMTAGMGIYYFESETEKK